MIGDVPSVVTTSKTGETVLAPERFKNAGELREVFQAMIRADRPRSAVRVEVDKQANGNPTYTRAMLKAKNQGWRARTNYRQMEGKLSDLGNVFYDVNTEVDPPVRIWIDYGKGQETETWQEIVAGEYGRMLLQQWDGFDYHIPLRNATMLRHGMGAHVWPTKGKWEPRTPSSGHILFPEDASVDFHTQGESFGLREWTPAHVLYGYIRNEKAAAAMGWDVKAVWEALAQTSKNIQSGLNTPEDYQRSMKAGGDYATSAKGAGVWLNYFFIIELESRKISQYVIAESLETSGKYLFKKRDRFEDFGEILVIFPYEIPVTGILQDIKGFGARTREHYAMLDRIHNAMADNVMISMYPMMQETGSIDPDKRALMRVGAFNWIPKGAEIKAVNMPNLAQGGIPLTQILNASLNENNQTYLAGTPEPKDRETALSFQMRAQDSSRVSKATHGLYYRNNTRFHKKALLTALKPNASNEPWAVLARELRQRCLDKGVPEAALSRIVGVEAMRSVGAGSASARLQAMTTLWQTIYPTTTEDRKIAIERDFCSAVAGYAQVDRYARSTKDADIPNQDDTIAALENDAMRNGHEVVANSAQDQVKHATSHLQDAGQIVQAVQQGQMDPAQGLQMIQVFGRHTASHLKMLEGNPMRKQEYDGLMKELMALSQFADQLHQQVQDAQDNPPPDPQAQASDTLQIGMAKVQADAQVKQAKFQHDASIKDQKFALDTRLKYGQAAANTRINAVKTAAEIQHKRLALMNAPKKQAA